MTAIETIYARHATRKFLPDKPVSKEMILELLEIAGKAASWSNSQPWEAYVVTGEPLQKMCDVQRELFKDVATKGVPAANSDIHSPSRDDWGETPRCVENMVEWSANRVNTSREEFGVDEKQYNIDSFDCGQNHLNYAPAWVILGVHKSLTPYSYFDLGSFATTFMLAAKEKGLDTMPAFSPCYDGQKLRTCVDIPEDIVAVAAIGIGYADTESYMNKIPTHRQPVELYSHFFGF